MKKSLNRDNRIKELPYSATNEIEQIGLFCSLVLL